ncbi:hypothetical protein GC194_15720 [bacterium]|nr:hypothetical protein [bacterium]
MTGGAGFSSDAKGHNRGNRRLANNVLGRNFKHKEGDGTSFSSPALSDEEKAALKEKLAKEIAQEKRQRMFVLVSISLLLLLVLLLFLLA